MVPHEHPQHERGAVAVLGRFCGFVGRFCGIFDAY
jgi:hypothetical protein